MKVISIPISILNRINNKILDFNWSSVDLFLMQLACSHVGVQLQPSNYNFLLCINDTVQYSGFTNLHLNFFFFLYFPCELSLLVVIGLSGVQFRKKSGK